eukprot:CAMPEP_0184715290 /NCGR_PEP_ID=MMETSP0314-20130426/5247_1 /TAXON_ID=38298 /ORGANISM="Rhodella maculata, Strain CCMP 736" /LENGTH=316 /DNA_ID=CAMNT_0027178387 /DNA_START=18 /DNA_END=968 /DNA_ORIENTATION=+
MAFITTFTPSLSSSVLPRLSSLLPSRTPLLRAAASPRLPSLRPLAMSADAVGPPVAAVLPAGHCVFGEEWAPAPLLEKKQLNHDTILLSFGLAEKDKPLGLPTCGCMLAKSDEIGDEPVIRPYTPVSTNAMVGKFDLMVKVYPDGKMSGFMDKMEPGQTVDFKHIKPNVKIQYPFNKKHIVMLVGGTGITPMIQALHAILGTESDSTKVTVLYGSKTEADILAKDVLDAWEASHPQLDVVHVLSNEPEGSAWAGKRGFIGADLIKEVAFGTDGDGIFFVCGPPPMYNALCGPREEADKVSGVLGELGYGAGQVYKF